MTGAPLISGISGIRGIAGESFTEEVVRRYADAFAVSLQPGAPVVLARDTRTSGAGFAAAASEALVEAGCRVVDCGVCSTPAAKLMVAELEAAGGVAVTASHNPAPWNGLKLIRSDGVFLNAGQAAEVEDRFRSGESRRLPGGAESSLDSASVCELHADRVLGQVDAASIRGAGLRAAVDPCNGAGCLELPPLLERLGVEAGFINAAPDGNFAHEPEPLPANLGQLGEAVREQGADFGFAVDPDADRVALVGPDGVPLGEDYTLALAVAAVTARRPGPVVTTLSTSQIVSDAAGRNGCPVTLTAVGEVHVVEKMFEEGAAIGGEGNGGVILTGVCPGRDAAAAVAVVLEALAVSGSSLQELAASLPAYAIEKRKLACSPGQLRGAVAALRDRYPKAWAHPVADGVKLYMEGVLSCPWIHLRASNTEPVVRVIAEAETPAEAKALCDEAESLLGESGKLPAGQGETV